MDKQLISYKKMRELFNQYPDLECDKLCYYIGICSTKSDLSDEEILKLMSICGECCSEYIHPVSLASDLTNAVYYEHYITLEDLENVPLSYIQEIFHDSKMYRLENYKSKVVVEKSNEDEEIEYGK